MRTPIEIYQKVKSEVDSIIDLFKSEEYKDVGEEEEFKSSIKCLEEIKEKLDKEMDSLEKNSEWEEFNIAFYGETNAGKSTLIEVLRILLEENSKMKERELFDIKKEEIQEILNEISSNNEIIKDINNKFNTKINSLNDKSKILKQDIDKTREGLTELEEEKNETENLVTNKKKSSVLNFILFYFGLLKEQQQLLELKKIIENTEYTINQYLENQDEIDKELMSLNIDMINEIEPLKNIDIELNDKLDNLNKELLNLSDGSIIGDGHSDYTKDVVSYKFSKNNQKFVILDMPGIEGNENEVKDAIDSAIKKAHVVFYIKKDPKPPGNGDDNEGTLQKIKNHLSQHTQVYSIFNKPAHNPKNIEKGLVTSAEEVGLIELEKVMKESLGVNYYNNIVLSAYPAFLAIGNSTHKRFMGNQNKFLKEYIDKKILLSKTNVDKFAKKIESEIISDYKNKIIEANYYKIKIRLNNTSESIKKNIFLFEKVKNEVENNVSYTNKQLDNATNVLKSNLYNTAIKEVNSFQTSLRQKIYCEIEKDIDSRTLKDKYEEISTRSIDELKEKLNRTLSNVFDNYKNELEHILKKHKRYEKEILESFIQYSFSIDSNTFEFNLNTEVDFTKLFSELILSIIGIIIGVAGGGLVAIALGVFGIIFNIGKNLYLAFDKDKKIADQKSRINEIINKTSNEIKDSIKEKLNYIDKDIDYRIKETKKELIITIEKLDSILRILKNFREKLKFFNSNLSHKKYIRSTDA